LSIMGLTSYQLINATQIRLELREHPQHVEEAVAGGSAGVNRLLGRLEGRPARPHRADDVLEIPRCSERGGRSA
jgi:hypothetical protein